MNLAFALQPFWLSLRVAAVATVLIMAAGLPLAYFLVRGQFPFKRLITASFLLPLVLPPTVMGYLLLIILGRRGPVGAWLERTLGLALVFDWKGAVVASAVTAFPLFLMPAMAAFEGVDPGLEDAARMLGRNERSVFFAVTLPLAWPGLAAGVILALVRALGDFGATLMLAGNIPGRTQTTALAIYDAVNRDDTATALGLTLLVSCFSVAALVLVQGPLRRGKSVS
jgi:molybdate transport system permease protein